MSTPRNLLWLLLHQGIGRGALFLFFLWLPREMGFDAYAAFSFAFVFLSTLVMPFMEFGLDLAVTKYASRADEDRIRKALIWRCMLVAGWSIAGILLALVAGLDVLLSVLILAYLGLVVMQNFLFAQLRGSGTMHVEGIAGTLQRAIPLLLLWLVSIAAPHGSLVPVLLLLAGTALGYGIIAGLFAEYPARLWRLLKHTARAASGGEGVVRESLILSVATLLGALYFRIDAVMLGLMVGETAAGEYFAATRVLEAVFVLPYVLMLAIFPKLSRGPQTQAERNRLIVLFALLGAAVAAAFFWAAPVFVNWFYGADLAGTIPILRILALSITPVYLGYLLTQSLVARDLKVPYLKITAVSLAVNVSLNAALIPYYQSQGAAWATFVTESLVTVSCLVVLIHHYRGQRTVPAL